MPNAGPYSGNDGSVYIAANVVAKVTSFKYSQTLSTRDQTALGDTWEQTKGGLKAVSGNVACWLDKDDTNGQEALTLGAEVTLILRHGTSSAPDVDIIAIIDGIDIDQGDGNSTVSVDFTFKGGIGATLVTPGTVS